ncbi:MAG: TIGR01440 family protein [Lactobacillales bacterium]|jgi:uncharacterized protein (TIGR01440 family)|nr:TIGR01440 family protein [Lactobacillales bacterium]
MLTEKQLEFLTKIKVTANEISDDILGQVALAPGDVFVLGCSSSEVAGDKIGTNSSVEIGAIIVGTFWEKLKEVGVDLAVQGCEHVNRSLVVERSVAKAKGLEIVDLIPALNAGGSAQVAAMKLFDDPVVVEEVVANGGVDIGDTFIGMHIKRVAVPVRPKHNTLGFAHVTACASRPKKIGGDRAQYNEVQI